MKDNKLAGKFLIGVERMKRILFPNEQLEINGMPWFSHNENKLWRFPGELKEEISENLWNQSVQTSGARIRFCSDTDVLGIKANYPQMYHVNNMCRIGQSGMDVYVDGQYWSSIWPDDAGIMEKNFFINVPRKRREFVIYLPIYNEVSIQELIFADDALIAPAKPFYISKPVVFYGTSITQGGCASRGGLSYQALMCRDLNLDFINLGFSGLGLGELPVAKVISQIDASCFVMDFSQNHNTVEDFERVYKPFISEIRKVRRETPIVLVTTIYNSAENWDKEIRMDLEGKRQVIRRVYKEFVECGEKNIYLVEGIGLLSPLDGDGLVDGGHPNDVGFIKMSSRFKPQLKSVLGIK
jgi:hypothetical protein